MPQFREDFFFVPFVTCSMIKAAMGRGFASWASNSAMLSFTDVTVECEKLGQLNEGCPLAEIWVTANGADGGASAGVQQGQTAEGLTVEPVEERLGGGTSAALAVPVARYALDFRYTNGVQPATGRVIETCAHLSSPPRPARQLPGVAPRHDSRLQLPDTTPRYSPRRYGARVSFNTDLCWYLDSTFCYNFHYIKQASAP